MYKTIVFIEYKYYDGRGNWDRELIKRLAKLDYEIHAITCPFPEEFRNEEDILKGSGVIFHFMPFNKIAFVFLSILEIFRLRRNKKFVLYMASTRLMLFYRFIKEILSFPIILSLQGGEIIELDIMPEFENLRNNKILHYLEKRFTIFREKFAAKNADIVIVISEAIKSELSNLGIPQRKIKVIYYAIDSNIFLLNQKKRKELRSAFRINDKDIVINYTARLSSHVPTKLWSAEKLINTIGRLSDNKNIKLLLVGGGDRVDYLKTIASKYDFDDRIIFTGFIPHEQIPNYISMSDFFWFIMRDPLPTYGLALLEAMSCENIVIANNSGSMKEVIRNGFNGFLVNPDIEVFDEELLSILSIDQNDLNSIKSNARKTVESTYSWDIILPNIINIFDKISSNL